jgi:arylsulfatase A-like enzyme
MMKKLIKLSIIFLLIVALAAFFYIKTRFWPPSKKPNVIVITAGSLRPSHLSCYGYGHIKSEAIDSLAQDGVLFENAYSNVPSSFYSYASILAGKNGGTVISKKGEKFVYDNSYKLLTQYLKSNGYTALAVISNPSLRGIPGFDVFKNISWDLPGEYRSSADAVLTEKALSFLSENQGKPIFMWIQYPSPQYPFDTPESFIESADDFPYDRQLLFLDENIEQLLKGLKKSGLYKNTIIVFTSERSEPFNEHRESNRSIFLYDSGTKIPLIVKWPKGVKDKKVDTLVSQIDIAPTILDILGIYYNPDDFDGLSLKSQLKGKETLARKVYLESLNAYHDFGWSPVVAWVSDGYKYIELPEPELYNLERDPHELKNIIKDVPEQAEKLRAKLLKYIEEERPQLIPILKKGVDPKKKIKALQEFTIKTNLIRRKAELAKTKIPLDLMISVYEDLLAKDPDNKSIKFNLAEFYIFIKKDHLAEYYLSDLVKKYPDFNVAWGALAMIYDRKEEYDNAIQAYEKAIAVDFDMPVSLNNLAWRYLQKNVKLDQALQYAQRANELVPNQPNFIDTLAQIYFKIGNKEKALELIKKAVELAPQNPYFKEKLENIESNNTP